MKKVLVLAIGLLFLSVLARTTSAAPVGVSSSTQLPSKIKGTLQAKSRRAGQSRRDLHADAVAACIDQLDHPAIAQAGNQKFIDSKRSC